MSTEYTVSFNGVFTESKMKNLLAVLLDGKTNSIKVKKLEDNKKPSSQDKEDFEKVIQSITTAQFDSVDNATIYYTIVYSPASKEIHERKIFAVKKDAENNFEHLKHNLSYGRCNSTPRIVGIGSCDCKSFYSIFVKNDKNELTSFLIRNIYKTDQYVCYDPDNSIVTSKNNMDTETIGINDIGIGKIDISKMDL